MTVTLSASEVQPDDVLLHDQPQQAIVVGTNIPGLTHVIGTTAANGLETRTIDDAQHLANPRRAIGTRTVSETLSFLDELDRRPLTQGLSTLWGDYTKGRVVAIYNDHDSERAGWRDDRLVLQLVDDPDWVRWHSVSGKWFSQYDFGDLIEELLHTVSDPDQADLLEIINSIRASQSGKFESKIERSTSDQELTYTTETTASAGSATRKLEVPKTITLRLRPWEGHVAAPVEGESLPAQWVGTYEVEAWFRLLVSNGELKLAIKLKPTQQLVRQAWAEAVNAIVGKTDIPVLAYRDQR
ncbi:DUF2303 family protein [Mycolicibacterium canariasense]|uniref:DUF2303 family protein n=1 Tax=Mycolicibacterium canariasense TaxID=228230 RepID=UPI000A1643AA|nr:DUF2303 family protein [Mycolicibacterium canariasense]MCV7208346.1 DUF2303 family protein [Mycolicibacterium canariasense]ORV13534.1 hypothetical protein AWB94_04740 [Mycolicibacterium canariasense]